LVGVAAINIGSRAKREVIVYREKKKDATDITGQSTNSEGELESRDTTTFRSTIQKLKGEKEIFQEGLNLICKQIDAGQGALYKVGSSNDKRILQMAAGYAMSIAESNIIKFEFGEGLVGQAAALGKSMYIEDVPTGYINILSGLGSASPTYLFIITLKKAGEVKAIVELATFSALKETTRKQLEEMAQVLVEQVN
jgi:methyl-accepting chemotaxis protein